jgi:hypothetical protein
MQILFFLHVIFMAATLIIIISAATIAHRKKQGWFVLHRKMALTGVGTALCGIAAEFTFKVVLHYPHFQSPHSIGGLITLTLLIITPATGLLIAKNPKDFRPMHITLGRITSVAVIATALMGIVRFIELSRKK